MRQSMNNGGGPACLRLRIRLTDEERAAVKARVFLDEALHADARRRGSEHYRDRLACGTCADPALARESMTALDELTRHPPARQRLRLPADGVTHSTAGSRSGARSDG